MDLEMLEFVSLDITTGRTDPSKMKLKPKHLELVAFSAIVTIALSVWCYLGGRESKTPIKLPEPEAVKTMKAELYNSPVGRRAIPEFRVPVGFIPQILNGLQPFKIHDVVPSPHDEIGRIDVITNDAEHLVIRIFWGGVNPVWFSINGVHYVHDIQFEGNLDEALSFTYLLEKAFRYPARERQIISVAYLSLSAMTNSSLAEGVPLNLLPTLEAYHYAFDLPDLNAQNDVSR